MAGAGQGRGLLLSRRAMLRAGLAGALALLVLDHRANAQPAPAQVASSASDTSFNEDWLFGGTYVAGSEAPGYSEAGFTPVTLPHTVVPLSWGGWDHTSWERTWIYRRHIPSSAVPAGSRAFVDFDAVMTSAVVFLNGKVIAQHKGGYLPFSVELTGRLTARDNVLAVVVDGRWQDVPPCGAASGAASVDYLQPAGIVRDAGLRIVPQVFIGDVFAKPTDVLTSPGLDVEVTIAAGSVPRGPVTVTATLLDGATQLASATTATTIARPGTATVTLVLADLQNITLWSPDSPQLYTVAVALAAPGIQHGVEVRTGFRQAEFRPDGFYLNGQRTQIFGLNRHGLFPYTGMAAAARLQRRDAELLRTVLNCNMVRCSHYPQSPAFLDACDELGLMVWEEAPGWQYVGGTAFRELVIENVRDMVLRDRNRPSVVAWGTRLNETSSNYATLWAQTRHAADAVDGTRPTSGAMYTQSTTGWAQDLFAYDDYHSVDGNATLEPPVAGVPYLVSEAVGALDGAPLYRWVDSDATLATQAWMHAQVHDIAQGNSAYAGLLAWAGIDYASINGGGRIWRALKWPGVLDTFRVPKPGAAVYRAQIDPSVRVVILPVFFWDFGAGGAGSPSTGPGSNAMIATNCDRLELYVDGAHLTTGTPDRGAFPNTRYAPVIVDLAGLSGATNPTLQIDGYLGDTPVGSLVMTSDPSQDRLVLTVEDSSIQGDGTDMTRFTFRALDPQGNQRPYVSGDVGLALSGPATLLADNPFPFAEYGGVGGGFIRSQAGGSGTVTLTASHPTLGQASGVVTVEAVPGAGMATPAIRPAPPSLTTQPAVVPPGKLGPKPPSAAAVRRALRSLLSPHARIATLVADGTLALTFQAPSAGKLTLEWDHVVHSGQHRTRREILATAHVSVAKKGRVRVTLRLTKRGRALLRHATRERVTIRAAFTPRGGSTTRMARTVELKR